MATAVAAAGGVPAAGIAAMCSEEVAEFEGAPEPGLTLFVQFTWSAGLRAGLPASPEAVLCRLLACDGERCWEGDLRRRDLAGPLGESWSDPGNLRLLLEALTPGSATSPGGTEAPTGTIDPTASVLDRGATFASEGVVPPARPAGVPRAEAIWTCAEGSGLGGVSKGSAPLQLSVRLNFNEGPVVAIRGVLFPPADLSAGLMRFFALAHGAQTAADACVAAADEERAALLKRREALQGQLDALPVELEEEEERLLTEFVSVLNAQKRRCRRLWEARRAELQGAEAPLVEPAGADHKVPPGASLEDCLDRGDPVAAPGGLDGERDDPLATMCSLTFATQPHLAASPPEPGGGAGGGGTGSAFTIPLTLGMGEFGEGLLARAASAAAFAAPAQPWPPSAGTAAGQAPASGERKRRK